MQQVEVFVSVLKKSLKARQVTYKDIAEVLELSESSVKRLFSHTGELSLGRIQQICEAFSLNFREICRTVSDLSDEGPWIMSREQEQAFAQDIRLLQLYTLLHNGKSAQEILKTYTISELELTKLLLKLDRLDLIESHPNLRYKIKRPGPYRLSRDGAVGKKLFEQTKHKYLDYDFENENSHIRFAVMPLPAHLQQKLKSQIDKLILDFVDEMKYMERTLGIEDYAILCSFRPWRIEEDAKGLQERMPGKTK